MNEGIVSRRQYMGIENGDGLEWEDVLFRWHIICYTKQQFT